MNGLQQVISFLLKLVNDLILITFIAEIIGEPFASSAAIDEAKLQPVPWVFGVFMREERNSKKSFPARLYHQQRGCSSGNRVVIT